MPFQRVALAAILLLGTVLRVYGLDHNGFGNPYYSAGVLSMTQSLHNFAFNVFDPAGVLAVDKPPVALWVQVVSARLFGFSPLSVLLPQAIEGILSIVLVWHLTRRRFGATAGLLAALVLAITPISVAVDRSSNTDSCLVLVLLLAARALLVAAERDSLRLLLLAMALVGVGFNVKMMAAFVVLPAFAATWWLRGGRHRLKHLAAGGAVCMAVSLAWVGAVDLTPAAARPFVDSSPDNSMLDLVVDHNALQRFFPRANAAPAEPVAADQRVPAGPLRLADRRLASQVGWLAPLALAGANSMLADVSVTTPAGLNLVFWLGWLAAYAIVYSAAGGLFSPYYLVTLAPAGWQVWLIVPASDPGAAIDAATAAQSGRVWLTAMVLGGVMVSGLGMMLAPRSAEAKAAAAVGLLALLAAPAAWTAETAFAHIQGARPMAALDETPAQRWRGDAAADPGLADFLRAHAEGARFLAATANARQAAPLIIATGVPVLAMGGFLGNIPVVTLLQLQALVSSRQVRFVLLEEAVRSGVNAARRRRYSGSRTEQQQAIQAWVHERGVPVDPASWRSAELADEARPALARLYDLRDAAE